MPTRSEVDTWAKKYYSGNYNLPDPRKKAPTMNHYYDFEEQDWVLPSTNSQKSLRIFKNPQE